MRASPRSTLWPQSAARKVRQAQQRKRYTVMPITTAHMRSATVMTRGREAAQTTSRALSWTATTKSGIPSQLRRVVAVASLLPAGAPLCSLQPLTRSVYPPVIIFHLVYLFWVFRSTIILHKWPALLFSQNKPVSLSVWLSSHRRSIKTIAAEHTGNAPLGEKFKSI